MLVVVLYYRHAGPRRTLISPNLVAAHVDFIELRILLRRRWDEAQSCLVATLEPKSSAEGAANVIHGLCFTGGFHCHQSDFSGAISSLAAFGAPCHHSVKNFGFVLVDRPSRGPGWAVEPNVLHAARPWRS